MEKQNANTKKQEVQTHIDECYYFLDAYLPKQYFPRTMEKLGQELIEGKPHKDHDLYNKIQNVRLRKNVEIQILTALVEVANEEKAKIERLKAVLQ